MAHVLFGNGAMSAEEFVAILKKKKLHDVDELWQDIFSASLGFRLGQVPFEEFEAFLKDIQLEMLKSHWSRRDLIVGMHDRLERGDLNEKESQCIRNWMKRIDYANKRINTEYDEAYSEYEKAKARRDGFAEGRDKGFDEGKAKGFAEGSAQFSPLWKEWKEAEGRYAKAKRKCERAERELAKAEMEMEELRRTASQRVAAERGFVIRCRNFARTYCREKENNASAAARELMEQDWFIAGIMVHTGRWWPMSKKDYAGKPTPENPTMRNPWKRRVQGNLGKAIMRWRTAGWALSFDPDDAGGDLVTRMRT